MRYSVDRLMPSNCAARSLFPRVRWSTRATWTVTGAIQVQVGFDTLDCVVRSWRSGRTGGAYGERWKIDRANPLTLGFDAGGGDHFFELPHVARPRIAKQRRHGSGPEAANRLPVFAGESLDEDLRQHRNIFAPFAEGGHSEAHGAEARGHVLAKEGRRFSVSKRHRRRKGNLGRQVDRSCRFAVGVGVGIRVGPELPVVEPVKKVGQRLLLRRRELMHPIQKEHAVASFGECRLRPSWIGMSFCRGKEVSCEARNERARRRRSCRVQGARRERFASAVLALESHHSEVRRHALHLGNELTHDRTAASQPKHG